LSKRFEKFTAVSDLSLSVRQNEVMAILGHNGAGKTTTINMVTGILGPDQGDVIVNGKSIVYEIDEVRKDLGLCQQHDVLYELLTVRENLELACELKDVPRECVEDEITEILKLTMLTDHSEKLISQLSGGMKRKLSLGMSIVSKPSVIILDEPSSGLDVESRRQIWDLIRRIKKGRAIIMSTQHIEEADELADQVCVMHSGKIIV
jgi:ATP-binding cassette subfamily A (ABC1) protein 3